MSMIRRRYLEWSMTTATFVVSPERLVAQPRLRIGAPWRLQTAIAATTSSVDFGTTTPIGAWR